MSTLNHVFAVLTGLSLFISGCAALPAQTGQDGQGLPQESAYESILGKPLFDEVVADFLASNNCASANQFLLCKTAGMALWIGSNQTVDTIYLYLNNTDGFSPYEGALPFGLKFYDTLEAVEYKLNRQGIGSSGRPDSGATPDRMHYQATYKEAGLTIIYNFPAPDEGATIRAVVVTPKKRPR
jgi:hypothetical protein